MPEEYVAYIISCVCKERGRGGRKERRGEKGGRERRGEKKRNAREGGERGRETTTKEEIINFECLGFGRTKLLAFKTYHSWGMSVHQT